MPTESVPQRKEYLVQETLNNPMAVTRYFIYLSFIFITFIYFNKMFY